jgi:hypothetical protein
MQFWGNLIISVAQNSISIAAQKPEFRESSSRKYFQNLIYGFQHDFEDLVFF